MKNNEDRKNREKNEEKLDILISNHEIGFSNFLRFIVFTILVSFYEVKFDMYRSRHPEVFFKKVFLEILQNLEEKACVGVSFLMKLQASTL